MNSGHYDETQSLLFFVNNLTDGLPPSCDDGILAVTNSETLVLIEGNRLFPVRNVTIRGMSTATSF